MTREPRKLGCVFGCTLLLGLFLAISISIGLFILRSAVFTESPTSENTPQEMFEYVIRKPIPTSVKHLEGVGYTWQGYAIYLRFKASKADIDSLIAAGYKPTQCSAIADRFVLPKEYNRFKPAWNPNLSSNQPCYEANSVKNSWTHDGAHYLVIDPKSGTVYFYGVGA